MKILQVHNAYQRRGGEDESLVNEVAMLQGRGHQVVEYLRSNDVIHGAGRLRAAVDAVWSRRSYRELRALLRRERPDVAHFHNIFPLVSPAGYYACRAEGVPVVQTLSNYRIFCVNGLLLRDGQPCEECLLRRAAWPGVVHACYRDSRAASAVAATAMAAHRAAGTFRTAVDLYLALSRFSRARFIEAGLPAERVVVKPNVVQADLGPGDGGGGFAVFVGRLSHEKGLDTLLDGWQQIAAPIKLKVVGSGPLDAMVAARAAADPRIEWLGPRPLAEVLELLGQAACLVMPSVCYETFGRVIAEAYSRGTPVVVSRRGAMAELVDEGRTGWLFDPGRAADLAEKVAAAFAGGRLPAMRAAARAAYLEHYAPEVNYRLLMSYYEGLIRKRAEDPEVCTAKRGRRATADARRAP